MRLPRTGCDIATTCSQLGTPEMKTGTVEIALISWHSVGLLKQAAMAWFANLSNFQDERNRISLCITCDPKIVVLY